MSKVLNKAEIFGELELATETVQLKNGTVIVSEIGAADYIKIWTDPANKNEDGILDMSRFTPALVAACIVDESGNRIFDSADVAKLARSANGPFMKLSEVASRLNGLSGEVVKNSEETAADSLHSVSASSSDTDTLMNCSEASQPDSSTSGEPTTK